MTNLKCKKNTLQKGLIAFCIAFLAIAIPANADIASELKNLISLADDDRSNFKRIYLLVDVSRGQVIRVEMETAKLRELPELMEKLGLDENDLRITQWTEIEFNVDENGEYYFALIMQMMGH